eukprot:5925579-Alexandrium_andersonii.AAC.1
MAGTSTMGSEVTPQLDGERLVGACLQALGVAQPLGVGLRVRAHCGCPVVRVLACVMLVTQRLETTRCLCLQVLEHQASLASHA